MLINVKYLRELYHKYNIGNQKFFLVMSGATQQQKTEIESMITSENKIHLLFGEVDFKNVTSLYVGFISSENDIDFFTHRD